MATYYIATTGNDTTGDGSSGNPWLTISKANSSSTTGDTIVLAAGTYTQAASLTLSARTYQGAGYDSTIIDFASGNFRLTLNGSVVTVQDLQVANIARTAEEFCIENTVSGAVISFAHVWLKSLVCGISRSIVGGDGGFGLAPSTTTFDSCIFTGCAKRTTGGTSSYLGLGSNSSSITLINCVIYDTAASSVGLSVVFGLGSSNRLFVFKNSILYSANSILFNVSGTQLYTGSATNCVFGWSSVPAGAAATITSDPLFVDAAGDNFNLRPTSPALNAGTLV